MSILESLQISLNGIAVVFIVLIAISLLVILQSSLVRLFTRKAVVDSPVVMPVASEVIFPVSQIAQGQLKLYDVDEKTAAMVMAIVSDESNIPLSELNFKSIKALV